MRISSSITDSFLVSAGPTGLKQKVKLKIRWGNVKRDFFLGRRFTSLDNLNAQVHKWLKRVNSTVHGTTYQIPLERFKEENLNPLGQVPPYKVVHKETEKSPKIVIFHFWEISILFLIGLQEEPQSFRPLKENSRFMLIARKFVNMKFFRETAELPEKRNTSRAF